MPNVKEQCNQSYQGSASIVSGAVSLVQLPYVSDRKFDLDVTWHNQAVALSVDRGVSDGGERIRKIDARYACVSALCKL